MTETLVLTQPLRTTLEQKSAMDPSLTASLLPSSGLDPQLLPLPPTRDSAAHPPSSPSTQQLCQSQVTAGLSASHSHMGLNQNRKSYFNS